MKTFLSVTGVFAGIGICTVLIGTVSFVGAQFTNLPPSPPHVSAITPPPVPFEQPFLRKHPQGSQDLYVPADKIAGSFMSVGNMELKELLDRVRTNGHNLYLLELKPKRSRRVPVTIEPEDLEPEPQHP